ncbi:protein phosphatase 2C [Acrasis kona]|uniref:Protein phosphatase 2C n=1 Tax=Acrasis kona TaxID=1008807 RepID=A0AAW2ZFP3_9EUKA
MSDTIDQEEYEQRLVKLAQRRRNVQVVDKKREHMNNKFAQDNVHTADAEEDPSKLQNSWLYTGFSETIGRRRTMEDAHVIETQYRRLADQAVDETVKDQVFIAIYDGHGGKDAAEYVGKQLHLTFQEKLCALEKYMKLRDVLESEQNENTLKQLSEVAETLIPSLCKLLLTEHNRNVSINKNKQESVAQILDQDGHSIEKPKTPKEVELKERSIEPIEIHSMSVEHIIPLLLRETFLVVNDKITQQNIRSGCTASVLYFDGKGLAYSANVGDSRIVCVQSDQTTFKRMTIDHRPEDPDEERRVKDAGGFVANRRVNAVLAVSRALGDSDLHPYVSSDPYTCTVGVKPGQCFIVACDGLWDVASDEAVINLIRDETDAQKASTCLKEHAYQVGSTDNISVIIVKVK